MSGCFSSRRQFERVLPERMLKRVATLRLKAENGITRHTTLLKEQTQAMESVKCARCGLINDLADETCQRCGVELEGSADSFIPRAPASHLPGVTFESPETNGKEFEIFPPIGPFHGIGDVLGPTTKLFTANFWLITKIIFVLFAPFEIFKAVSFDHKAIGWQIGVGTVLLGLFCKALVAPSLIYAMMTVMRTGVAPSLNESYRWGLSKMGKVVACSLMAGVLVALGYVCLIIPGIILGVAFELIYPMAALENFGPVEILERSYRMTKGYRWRIFCASFVVLLLVGLVNIPAGIVSSLLVLSGVDFWPVNAVLAMAVDILSESTTILSLVIYLSILASTPSGIVRSTSAVVES